MKTIITAAILLLSTIMFAQTETFQVKVTVPNARNDNGKMLIALHTQDSFMKSDGKVSESVIIKDGVATVTFNDVPAGTYAILILHDENENYRMDFETSGMPKESYGTSGNAMSYGPPTWSDAKFELEEDTNLVIRL